MLKIAAVGKQIIHTFATISHFNGCDWAKVAQYNPGWASVMKGQGAEPLAQDMRVTRVWGENADAVTQVADACAIDRIAGSVEEAMDGVDAVMVLDEVLETRTALIEQALNRGLPVFADKVLSPDPVRTEELFALADSKGVDVRAWSQLYFTGVAESLHGMKRGGVAFVAFKMAPEIVPKYAIHPISVIQGLFRSPVATCRVEQDADCVFVALRLADATKVMLHMGTNVPHACRVLYLNEDRSALVEPANHYSQFRGSARCIAELFRGRPTREPGRAQMLEASRILGVLMDEDAWDCEISLQESETCKERV